MKKAVKSLCALAILPFFLAAIVFPASAATNPNISVPNMKNIGGSDMDVFSSIAQTADGGYIAAGNSWSNDGDFAGLNKGNMDAIVVKFDSSGNAIWVKDIGGSSQDMFSSIVPTSDGGYIAAGYSESNDGDFAGLNKGYMDAIVVKFDSSGNTIWVKDIGGINQDTFSSIVQTADGGYIATGSSESSDGDFTGLNKGYEDAIIVKFNSSGNMIWVKNFGGSNMDGFSFIVQTADGGYIAVGYSGSSDGDFAGLNKGGYDAIVVKFDSSDNMIWLKDIGGSSQDTFSSIVPTADGGYIAAGSSQSSDSDFAGLNKGDRDAVVVKFDSSGNRKWLKSIGGSDDDPFSSIVPTADGGYIAAGFSISNDGDFAGLNKGGGDAFVVKFDSSGNTQLVKDIGGSNTDTFSSIIQTTEGGYIAAGYSRSNDGNFTGLNKGDKDALISIFTTVPLAPTNVNVTPGNGEASVSFSVPAKNGGSTITGYTVTATPSNGKPAVTATGSKSPIKVSGLRNGVSYSFTVAAINLIGSGLDSSFISAMPVAAVSSPPSSSLSSSSSLSNPNSSMASSQTSLQTSPETKPQTNPQTDGSHNTKVIFTIFVLGSLLFALIIILVRKREKKWI